MKAILLAAGVGSRLKPLTDTCPKCLMPIGGKPLLGHWLDTLQQSSWIDEICVNLHYLKDQVASYIEDLPKIKSIKTVYEPQLLGTGGTVKANQTWLGNHRFMLIHADNFSSLKIDEFVEAHLKRPPSCLLTMLTFHTDNPQSCGIVHTDKNGIVTDFYEKSNENHGNIANGAVYICEPELLDFINDLPSNHISFSDDVLPNFIGKIFTHHLNDYHIDIGTPETYKIANHLWD